MSSYRREQEFARALEFATTPKEARAVFAAAGDIEERRRWDQAGLYLTAMDQAWITDLLDHRQAYFLSRRGVHLDDQTGPMVVRWIQTRFADQTAPHVETIGQILRAYTNPSRRRPWWPDPHAMVAFIVSRLKHVRRSTIDAEPLIETLVALPETTSANLLDAFVAHTANDNEPTSVAVQAFADDPRCDGRLARAIWQYEERRKAAERKRAHDRGLSALDTWSHSIAQQHLLRSAAVWASPTMNELLATPAVGGAFVHSLLERAIPFDAARWLAALRTFGRHDPKRMNDLLERVTPTELVAMVDVGLVDDDLQLILARGGANARRGALEALGRMGRISPSLSTPSPRHRPR